MSMLAHWASVKDRHDTVVEFFEWLQQQKIHVALVDEDDNFVHGVDVLARRWLEVDDAQLERERREVVESLMKEYR